MNEAMEHKDALELVKLRMKEDKVSWAVAFKEYCELTQQSFRSAMYVADILKSYKE